ncbi:hypothetical protein EYF80_062951 [Liparis tanakae]|uniref:Uncharacterized protein n=1 Tax=Liparis tanakae TaxID=230148 RepID=A0A4Z2EDC6_9TELE|nr:hypothetical protein EYF80_062951 [Liparis tanakae]
MNTFVVCVSIQRVAFPQCQRSIFPQTLSSRRLPPSARHFPSTHVFLPSANKRTHGTGDGREAARRWRPRGLLNIYSALVSQAGRSSPARLSEARRGSMTNGCTQ